MSAAKRKGTAHETAVCAHLNGLLEYTHPTDWRLIKRVAQAGARDQGDAHAWPFVLEMKDVKSPAVPTWIRQAETEARNAGFPFGVVVHKTRGKGIALSSVHISDTALRGLSGHMDGCPVPSLNARHNYWTWSLAEFAGVLQKVREEGYGG